MIFTVKCCQHKDFNALWTVREIARFQQKKKNLTSLTTGFRHVAIGLKSGFLSEHLKYTQSGVGCWASKKEKEIIGERETGN